MKEWFGANWMYVLVAIVYVLERTSAISSQFAAKVRALVAAISRVDNLNMTAAGKEAVKASGLNHDPDIDLALDTVNPEDAPRVSKGKRILRGFVKVLPVISRFFK